MKPLVIAFSAIALAAATATAGEFDAWGPVLVKHELRALDGTATASLGDLQGEVTVVNFWASWCKPCRKELVELDAMTRRLEPAGVRVVAVSIDHDVRKAARFIDGEGLSLPVYHDGPDGLARELDLPWLPCTVVMDAAGRVVRVDGGGDPETMQALESAVRSMTSRRDAALPADEEAAG
ncbi:MAG TPA: TlpA disulfide reductase family protein [bacterium]|nr:TlpA disulfide reductase family protein [bacterium]